MRSVLFVCLGNICRSPAGEEILRKKAGDRGIDSMHIASCGLGDWHKGQLPDERMRKAASARGYELTSHAQSFRPEFFETFECILAADNYVLNELRKRAASKAQFDQLYLAGDFSRAYHAQEIPDPYHGESEDFEHVLDRLEEICDTFLEKFYPAQK